MEDCDLARWRYLSLYMQESLVLTLYLYRDCVIAHGASALLRDRMLDNSDMFRLRICRQCNLPCLPKECAVCKKSGNAVFDDIAMIKLPYPTNLLQHELGGLHIGVRFMT